jgi:hypothetical protein
VVFLLVRTLRCPYWRLRAVPATNEKPLPRVVFLLVRTLRCPYWRLRAVPLVMKNHFKGWSFCWFERSLIHPGTFPHSHFQNLLCPLLYCDIFYY